VACERDARSRPIAEAVATFAGLGTLPDDEDADPDEPILLAVESAIVDTLVAAPVARGFAVQMDHQRPPEGWMRAVIVAGGWLHVEYSRPGGSC
jgi:hypothetical protein